MGIGFLFSRIIDHGYWFYGGEIEKQFFVYIQWSLTTGRHHKDYVKKYLAFFSYARF